MLQILMFYLAFLPGLFILILIIKYSVDVPYWDQWEIALFFDKLAQGSLSLKDLFAQQNEYRQFFPNLIFVALGWLTSWNVKYEMLISFLFSCLISFNIYKLQKLTLHGNQLQRILIFFVSNILVFSPIQYENWLFGVQIIYFIPIFCITTCIIVAYSKLGTSIKFFLCICLAVISTFSSANGILCWVIILPILVVSESRNQLASKKWPLLGWVIISLLSTALYFYKYQTPPHHPSLSEPISHPLNALIYLLAFLGGLPVLGIYRTYSVALSSVVGLMLIVVFLISYSYKFRISKNSCQTYGIYPWLAVAMYSILTAILATFARLGFGVHQALSSRYTTFSLYITISLINVMPIIAKQLKRKGQFSRYKAGSYQIIPLAMMLIVLFHLSTFNIMVKRMELLRLERLQAKACLLFINHIEDECLVKKVYWDVNILKQRANALNNLGYLRPNLIESNRVYEIAGADEYNVHSYGAFESLQRGDRYVASGWATLPERGEPPDAILLAYDNVDGYPIVFALTNVGAHVGLTRSMLQGDPQSRGRWHKSFSLDGLPASPLKFTAWAFDAERGKAFKLNGIHAAQTHE
jgi:hypothetical protein